MPPSRQLASRFTQFCLTAALALVPTGASAAAQVITAVAPGEGSLGTVLSISGSGFGPGRPTVLLSYADAGGGRPRQFRLTLRSYSDGELHARIDKALPGPCKLRVLPASGLAAEADFAVAPPQAGSVQPLSAGPGEPVVISGAHFGTKGLKVSFFDRRATVIALQDDSVTALVPPGLPDGQWAPLVSNVLGSDLADSAVAVEGGGIAMPADFVRAAIGSLRFSAQAADLQASIIGLQIAFNATQSGPMVQQLSVQLPFSMSSSPVPSVFSGAGVVAQPIFYLQSSPANGASSMWMAMPGVQPWQVAIVGRNGNHLAGSLEADLVRVAGAGPDVLHIRDGLFVVSPHF